VNNRGFTRKWTLQRARFSKSPPVASYSARQYNIEFTASGRLQREREFVACLPVHVVVEPFVFERFAKFLCRLGRDEKASSLRFFSSEEDG